jgi:hypothetical protein
MGLFLRGERAPEGGDGNWRMASMAGFLGELRVGERLDAGLELAQKNIDGQIEAGLAGLEQKLALDPSRTWR